MRVLVTWGSKRGGTEGLGRMLAEDLRDQGLEVEAAPAREAKLAGFDAVIVGGALYANRWHRDAGRFVRRNAARLAEVPVWFFSSGPLDGSAEERAIPPTPQVRSLMRRVGAQGHVTFGGRLSRDARGFVAAAMAEKHAGDWRDPRHVRAWAEDVARALPHARPLPAEIPASSRITRLLAHGVAGWAVCAAILALLAGRVPFGAVLALRDFAAALVFIAVSMSYFRKPDAYPPLGAAFGFAGIVFALDLVVVAGLVQRSAAMLASPSATWLPLALVFLATWGTGQSLERGPRTPIPGRPLHA